jgi:hypothetical protein
VLGSFQRSGQRLVVCHTEAALLHVTDSRVQGCQIVAERVKIKNIEGQMGQHAARPPYMVRDSFPPPRAVMLTLSRHLG